MERKDLLGYFNAHSRTLKSELRRITEQNAVDAVHDMRVDIKRIRFLLLLLNRFATGTHVKALYTPYQKLFRQLGEVRGLHMKDQLLRQYAPAPATEVARARISRRTTRLIRRLIDRRSKWLDVLTQAHQAVRSHLSKFISVPATQYAHSLAIRVGKKFTAHAHRTQWHEDRKILKEVMYAREVSPSLRRPVGRLIDIRKADLLQARIGDWHDLVLQREWFKVDTDFLLTLPHEARVRAMDRMKRDSLRLEGLIQNSMPYLVRKKAAEA
jgi:CHAD domain-containing protein